MPPTMQQIFNDKDFYGLPKEERYKVLSSIDPDFEGLPPKEQEKAFNGLRQKFSGQSQVSQPKEEQPSWLNKTGSNIIPDALRTGVETAQGLWGLAKLGGQAMNPLSPSVIPQVATGLKQGVYDPLVEALKNPSQIPSKVSNYVQERPVATAMNISSLLGGAGAVADLGNLSKTANVLSKASELTNPISLATKPIAGVANAIAKTKIPQKIYGSAVKLPLTKKWIKNLPSEDISQRTRVIQEGLNEKVRPSEYGKSLAQKLERQSREAVDNVIKDGAYKSNPIVIDDILNAGLKDAYDVASNSSDPIAAKAAIDNFAIKFKSGHGDAVSATKANQIKRQLYKEINWVGDRPTGLSAQLKVIGKKGLSHQFMSQLEDLYPELHDLNYTDGARIGLSEAITRAIARNENKDLLGLGTKVLAGRSIPLAIWESTMGHPQIKASLAFALKKANRMAIKAKITNIPFVASEISNKQNNQQGGQ